LTARPPRRYAAAVIQLGQESGLTAEDLFLISSSDCREELDRGVLVRMPPAGALHGCLASRMAHLLEANLEDNPAGVVCGADTGFILGRAPDTVRAPDASFVARERVPAGGPPAAYWPLTPDLAVEVVSPSDRIDELDEKIEQYFAAGTRLVWVLHARPRTLHAYRSPSDVRVLGVDDELSGEPVLFGFRCPLRRVFD
jgi:Uma2 family endonuclease